MDNTEFHVNCWIFGQAIDTGFVVTVHPSYNVAHLKALIKIKDPRRLGSFEQSDLSLFRINVAADDFDEILGEAMAPSEVPDAQKLSPFSIMSKIFDGVPPESGHIHIIVQPLEGSIQYHGFDGLVQLRQGYLRTFLTKSKPPSELAQPRQIPKDLADSFHYSRLHAHTVPITLLHPVFNKFIDNCENYQPSADDHSFVRDLADGMNQFYPLESDRQAEFIRICRRYGLEFQTDCDMRCQGCIYCLGKVKVEMGAGGAEPVIQAACCYTSHLQQSPDLLRLDSPLPCLGLYLAGPTLGFFGLVFTDRTNIQILNPPIRLDYHYTDVKQRRTAARYMAAFRQAAKELELYYNTEIPGLRRRQPQSKADPRFPCYSCYTSLVDGTVHKIAYTSQLLPDKLIFLGKSGDDKICIKFVTRYCKEAHRFCAELGVAPVLYGFEELGGGWFMVVMERVRKKYEILADSKQATPSFRETFGKGLAALHREGYVHGDIRDTNVMVRRDGEEGFMLLDFDWSGPTGKAFYPMNVNKGPDLWRPEDVYDEAEILVEHDNQMADRIFSQYCFVENDIEMRHGKVP